MTDSHYNSHKGLHLHVKNWFCPLLILILCGTAEASSNKHKLGMEGLLILVGKYEKRYVAEEH